MSTCFKLIRPLLVFAVAVWTPLAVGSGASAQSGAQAPAHGTPDGLALFNLDFEGGVVRDYVQVIRDVLPTANIVIAPEAELVRVPPVVLRQVDLSAAMDLLGGIQTSRGDTLVPRPVSSVAGVEVWVVGLSRARMSPGMMLRESDITTRSIGHLIKRGLAAEGVLDAVEAAVSLAMGPDASSMKIRFHEPTSLLLVSGPPAGVGAAVQVVDALTKATTPSEQELEQEARLQTIQAELEATLAAERAKAANLANDNSTLERLVKDLSAMMKSTEQRRQETERLIQEQREEIERLRAELQSVRGGQAPRP